MAPVPENIVGPVKLSRTFVVVFAVFIAIVGGMALIAIGMFIRTREVQVLAGGIIMLPVCAVLISHLCHAIMSVRRAADITIHPRGLHFESQPHHIIPWGDIDAELVPPPLGPRAPRGAAMPAFQCPGIELRLSGDRVYFLPAAIVGYDFIKSALGLRRDSK